MKKILIIGATSKIAERFIENFNNTYEFYGTFRSEPSRRKDNVRYIPLDLNSAESVEEFVASIEPYVFSGVFVFSSTYTEDVIDIDQYLLSAERDLRINVLSPIAILKHLRYESPATIFLFADAGLQKPKKNFTAYSVSKQVLSVLGTLLAVELADAARVVIFKLGPTLAPDSRTEVEKYYARTLYRVDEPVEGLVRYCQFLMNERNLSMTGSEIIYDGGAYLKR